MSDFEGVKPGWTRLNLAPWASDEEVKFILDAVEFVAEYGERFVTLYDFNWRTGAWTHPQDQPPADLFGDTLPLQQSGPVAYDDYLSEAHRIVAGLTEARQRKPVPNQVPQDLVFFAY